MPTPVTRTQEEEFKTWKPEASALAIEYAVSVMEDLRQAGEQGFQTIPHGGIEIGAILFGTRTDSTVRICEWRPIECSHARGPGFILTPADLQRLSESLAQARSEMPGLEPVGWFHTHTRSEIFLSPEDIEIFSQYFPEPWQVALVMRLKKESPATAGFFVRQPDGALKSEASYQEFTVRPDPFALTRPRRPTSAAARGTDRHPRPPRVEGRPPAAPTPPPIVSEPLKAPEIRPATVPTFRTAALHLEERVPEPEPLPAFLTEPPPSQFRRKVIFGAVVAAILAALTLGGRWYWVNQPPPSVGLRLEEASDQLLIQWDRGAEPIRTAEGATLTIRDGKEIRNLVLDQRAVRLGTVTYAYREQDVEVRLIVMRQGQVAAEESTRFLGRRSPTGTAAAPSPGAAAEGDQFRSESERLRQAIRQETERTQRLENSLKALQNQPPNPR